jgi:16S rRNA processing protein RimM
LDAAKRILVGAIAGAHGVRGEVKIKSFTADPRSIGRYGPVEDETGARSFKLTVRGETKGLVIARLDGVADRNQAEALKGLRLYVPRAKLPRPKRGEWYVADLIGLAAQDEGGTPLGRVKSVQNFGAGDVIELERADGTTEFLPFTRAVVPEVDIEGGKVVIAPPDEIEVRDETDEQTDEDEKGIV